MNKRSRQGGNRDPKIKDPTEEIRASIRRTIAERLRRNKPGANERRNGQDRRGWQSMPRVPFADSSGVLVTHDRRKRPDRRLSNIHVRWRVPRDEGN